MRRIFKTYIIALSITLIFNESKAQKKGFFEGFIIEQNGDTLWGHIKDRDPVPFTELKSKIRFKQNGKSPTRKFGPEDIKAYSYNDALFESVCLREDVNMLNFRYIIENSVSNRFLKVIDKDPYLIYYHLEYIHDDNFYLDYIPLFYKPGNTEMCRVSQGILGLKRKKLIEYFSDCKALTEAISKKRINDINEVYQFYINDCVRAKL
ncbi:MAG: hypothetical protein RH860_12235 [Cytophagales bacterium]